MVFKAKKEDLSTMAALAVELWPHHTLAEMEEDFTEVLETGGVLFFAVENGIPAGFAQCQLRHDYVEGTEHSPVGYLEGIYVREDFRGNGLAGELLRACEQWAAMRGCREFASDCELDNEGSLAFHLAAGFTEANRIICFVKSLKEDAQ